MAGTWGKWHTCERKSSARRRPDKIRRSSGKVEDHAVQVAVGRSRRDGQGQQDPSVRRHRDRIEDDLVFLKEMVAASRVSTCPLVSARSPRRLLAVEARRPQHFTRTISSGVKILEHKRESLGGLDVKFSRPLPRWYRNRMSGNRG